MNVGERIEAIISNFNLNKNSFSKELGLKNNSTIGQIVSGRNKPSFDIMQKIALKFPTVNIHWLLTGEGEMIKTNNLNINPTNNKEMSLLNVNNQLREEINFLKDQIKKKDQQIEELFRIINTDNSKTKGRSTA